MQPKIDRPYPSGTILQSGWAWCRVLWNDISEFESDLPSQPVRSLWAMSGLQKYARHSRELTRRYAVSEAYFFDFRPQPANSARQSLVANFQYPSCYIRDSVRMRPVRYIQKFNLHNPTKPGLPMSANYRGTSRGRERRHCLFRQHGDRRADGVLWSLCVHIS